ncbi:MAG: hypothetical protein AAFU49_03740 [Pseudomonadota bacterium]
MQNRGAPPDPTAGDGAPASNARRLTITNADLDAAQRWLHAVDQARPDLTRAPSRPSYKRGIEVIVPDKLRLVVARALIEFHRAHRRKPDLLTYPGFCDRYFELKFFGYVPMPPNPADKLTMLAFVPPELRDQVQEPKRPWMSQTTELPADDQIAPGTYYLKRSLGNNDYAHIRWPLAPADRNKLQPYLERWLTVPYGVSWGEWWYGISENRIFLEEDLTERLRGHPEWRVYVRRGEPRLINLIVQDEEKSRNTNVQRWFDADLRPLNGVTTGRRQGNFLPPPYARTYLKVAAGIGRPFDLVRIDFLDVGDERPMLSEITVCDYNARRRFDPPEFEHVARDILFG